jgi:hypothetical protein
MNAASISPLTIQAALDEQITRDSGLDPHRDYLGISKVIDCPRRAVKEFLYGMTDLSDTAHRMCFAGYEHERSVIELLSHAGIVHYAGIEVTAPFDKRLKGHIDAQSVDGDLIEIKSVSTVKFQKVNESGKALRRHFLQVQLYMRYGHWQQAFVIYRCRETYEHKVIRVPYVPSQADRLEEKAKLMLAFIDREELPACECGHCQ